MKPKASKYRQCSNINCRHTFKLGKSTHLELCRNTLKSIYCPKCGNEETYPIDKKQYYRQVDN